MNARHINGPLVRSGFGDSGPDDDGEAYFAAEVDAEIDAMCRSATVVDHALRELHAENEDAFFAGLALLIAANPTHTGSAARAGRAHRGAISTRRDASAPSASSRADGARRDRHGGGSLRGQPRGRLPERQRENRMGRNPAPNWRFADHRIDPRIEVQPPGRGRQSIKKLASRYAAQKTASGPDRSPCIVPLGRKAQQMRDVVMRNRPVSYAGCAQRRMPASLNTGVQPPTGLSAASKRRILQWCQRRMERKLPDGTLAEFTVSNAGRKTTQSTRFAPNATAAETPVWASIEVRPVDALGWRPGSRIAAAAADGSKTLDIRRGEIIGMPRRSSTLACWKPRRTQRTADARCSKSYWRALTLPRVARLFRISTGSGIASPSLTPACNRGAGMTGYALRFRRMAQCARRSSDRFAHMADAMAVLKSGQGQQARNKLMIERAPSA